MLLDIKASPYTTFNSLGNLRNCGYPPASSFLFLIYLNPPNMAPSSDLPVMTDIFLSIPPEIQAITPAGMPPAGVIPNLSNPPTIGYTLVAVASILMAIMLMIVCLRFYSALYVRRKVHADDWTTLAAVVSVWKRIYCSHS